MFDNFVGLVLKRLIDTLGNNWFFKSLEVAKFRQQCEWRDPNDRNIERQKMHQSIKENKHYFEVNAKLSIRHVTPAEVNDIILKLDDEKSEIFLQDN